MKRILLCFFLFLTQPVFSQEYFPILESNNSWDVLGMSIQQTGPCGYGFGSRYVIAGDTFINGYYYKSIKSHSFMTADGNPYFCPPYGVSTEFFSIDPEFYLREDTIQQKIFLFGSGGEKLLFDFNYKIGDSLQDDSYKPTVTKIDSTTLLNGEKRKRFYIGKQSDEFIPYAIEGVGFTCGFQQYIFECECYYTQICVKRNNEPIYIDSAYSSEVGNCCFYYSGIPEEENVLFEIFPDPAFSTIQLHLPTSPTTLSIFNLLGEKVKEQKVTTQEVTMDVSELPAGMYVVKTENSTVGKFVKE